MDFWATNCSRSKIKIFETEMMDMDQSSYKFAHLGQEAEGHVRRGGQREHGGVQARQRGGRQAARRHQRAAQALLRARPARPARQVLRRRAAVRADEPLRVVVYDM